MLMPSKISSMFNAAVGIQEKYALKNPLHQPNPQLSRAMPCSPLLGASLSLSFLLPLRMCSLMSLGACRAAGEVTRCLASTPPFLRKSSISQSDEFKSFRSSYPLKNVRVFPLPSSPALPFPP